MLSPLEKGDNQEQIYLNLSSLKADLTSPAPLKSRRGVGGEVNRAVLGWIATAFCTSGNPEPLRFPVERERSESVDGPQTTYKSWVI